MTERGVRPSVLVTGGCGYVGAILLRDLTTWRPARRSCGSAMPPTVQTTFNILKRNGISADDHATLPWFQGSDAMRAQA